MGMISVFYINYLTFEIFLFTNFRISLNIDEFKFSQELNFFKCFKTNININSEIKENDIREDRLISDNQITEQLRKELDTKSIVSSNNLITENLDDLDYSYRNGSNLKIKNVSLNNDSIMHINDQKKEKLEAINNRKRRIAHHIKKNENMNNAKIRKLFNKKNDNDEEEERGKCSRCEIL